MYMKRKTVKRKKPSVKKPPHERVVTTRHHNNHIAIKIDNSARAPVRQPRRSAPKAPTRPQLQQPIIVHSSAPTIDMSSFANAIERSNYATLSRLEGLIKQQTRSEAMALNRIQEIEAEVSAELPVSARSDVHVPVSNRTQVISRTPDEIYFPPTPTNANVPTPAPLKTPMQTKTPIASRIKKFESIFSNRPKKLTIPPTPQPIKPPPPRPTPEHITPAITEHITASIPPPPPTTPPRMLPVNLIGQIGQGKQLNPRPIPQATPTRAEVLETAAPAAPVKATPKAPTSVSPNRPVLPTNLINQLKDSSDKILNPFTNRMVKKDGKTGKEILKGTYKPKPNALSDAVNNAMKHRRNVVSNESDIESADESVWD